MTINKNKFEVDLTVLLDKHNVGYPFEYIQCPYCGHKLSRVGKAQNLPTSCMHCNKHNIDVNIKKCIIW